METGKKGVGGKNPGHLGIEINWGDALDLGILRDFTNGEAVAPAENQDAARSRDSGQSGMDKRFRVAVFVAATELQMTVEKKAQAALAAGAAEILIPCAARKENFLRVSIHFAGAGVHH